jgi:tetratricopeptide (TPR) repeat protein
MPIDPLLVALLKLAGERVFGFMWTQVFDRPNPSPILAASQRAANQFPEFENLERTLAAWSRDAKVGEALQRLSGGVDPTDADCGLLVTRFKKAGFYSGQDTDARSSAVLACFIGFLREELLVSDRGHIYQTNRLAAEAHLAANLAANRTVSEVTANVEQLIRGLAPAPALALSTPGEPGNNPIYDMARKLMNRGRLGTASDMLRCFGEEEESARNAYEWLALTGHCALVARDVGLAVERFRAALERAPQRAAAHANLAQALMLSGAEAEAVQTADAALALDALEQRALLVKAQIQSEKDLAAGIAVAEQIPDAVQRAYVVGAILKRAGRYADSIPHLQSAVDGGLRESDVLMRLAEARVEVASRRRAGPGPAVWELEKTGLGLELREAERFATMALDVLPDPPPAFETSRILAFRAHVRAFGGMPGALDDANKAADGTADPQVAVTLARTYMALREAEKAVQTLKSYLQGGGRDAEAARLFAQMMADTGEEAAALALVESLELVPLLGSKAESILRSRVSARRRDFAEAKRILATLPPEERDMQVIVAEARIALDSNDPTTARTILTAGPGSPNKDDDWKLSLWVARTYLTEHNWPAAVSTLAPLLNTDSPEELVNMYIDALDRADHLGTAVEAARHYLKSHPHARTVVASLAAILARLGHIESALALYDDLLSSD